MTKQATTTENLEMTMQEIVAVGLILNAQRTAETTVADIRAELDSMNPDKVVYAVSRFRRDACNIEQATESSKPFGKSGQPYQPRTTKPHTPSKREQCNYGQA